MNKGILVVVSGFSGAGKGTVMKRLMEKYDDYALSVSATTRKPRPGEEDGREYFFRTRDEFEKLIEEDALLPVILDKMRSGWLIVLAGFGLSVTVEVIQLITKVGCFDVDDMILNTAGAALGYLLFFICDHLRRKIYGKKI